MRDPIYSTAQAAEVLGALARADGGDRVSAKHLERWEAAGVLVPSVAAGTGRGSRRAYDFHDLLCARAVGVLLDERRMSMGRAAAIVAAVASVRGAPLGHLALQGDLRAGRWRVVALAEPTAVCAVAVTMQLAALDLEIREALTALGLAQPIRLDAAYQERHAA